MPRKGPRTQRGFCLQGAPSPVAGTAGRELCPWGCGDSRRRGRLLERQARLTQGRDTGPEPGAGSVMAQGGGGSFRGKSRGWAGHTGGRPHCRFLETDQCGALGEARPGTRWRLRSALAGRGGQDKDLPSRLGGSTRLRLKHCSE